MYRYQALIILLVVLLAVHQVSSTTVKGEFRRRHLGKVESEKKGKGKGEKNNGGKGEKGKGGKGKGERMVTDVPSDVPSDAPFETPSDAPSDVPSDMPSDMPSATTLDDALARSLPLRQALTEENLIGHLQALQDIADANDSNRFTNTTGYAASVDYVVSELEAAGYVVEVQHFPVDLFFDLGGSTLVAVSPDNGTVVESYLFEQNFTTVEYSGSGEAMGLAQKVDNLGCEAADFETFQSGNIAIIERGICTFRLKVEGAQMAGAVGVIIYNDEDRRELFDGTLREAVTLPVFFATFDVGVDLIGKTLSLFSNVSNVATTTQNIIADTEFGNPDQTIVIGGHVDSVITSPGINDNGSAVAVALDLALQIAKNGFQSKNKIRFAFWGAEELGLLGSEHYLRNLFFTKGAGAIREMKLYLNLEMLASANFVRAIYPPMSSTPDSINIEAQVTRTFQEFFDAEGIVAVPLPDAFVPDLRGRSDHANFQDELVNIPAGGVITGADIPKPPEFVFFFGGEAGVWTAPCYHQLCDDLDNARTDVMHELGDGYAHTLWTFANMDEIEATENRRLETLTELHFTNRRLDPNSRFYAGGQS